jgi:16S rRNA (guanine966-N2)-methyltransferase
VRIVAGLAKGRRLATPAGATRPTSDRAREALFNTLAGLVELDGASVLDLFAGTGAVGLEALSRGASRAVFVESDRAAADVLKRNVDTVGLAGAQLVRRPVAAYLDAASEDSFDVVFADPPYALTDEVLASHLGQLCAGSWLASNAVIIVERSARGAAPTWPDCITALREKKYGEGVLWYGRRR